MAAQNRGAAQPGSELPITRRLPLFPSPRSPSPPFASRPLPPGPHTAATSAAASRNAAPLLRKAAGRRKLSRISCPSGRALSAPRLPGSAGGRDRLLHVAMAQPAQNSPENPTAVRGEQPAAGGRSNEVCAGNGCPRGGNPTVDEGLPHSPAAPLASSFFSFTGIETERQQLGFQPRPKCRGRQQQHRAGVLTAEPSAPHPATGNFVLAIENRRHLLTKLSASPAPRQATQQPCL